MLLASPPQRILIIRPSALGDVCRTVPVLASLRAAWPDATIDWVVQYTFAEAIAAHPALTSAIPFPRRDLAGWWRNPRIAARTWRWFADLRRARYDLVLDCQGLGRSGLMAFATRARRRLGHRNAREFGWLGVNHRVGPRQSTPRHTVDAMLELIEALGIEVHRDMTLHVPQDARQWWGEQSVVSAGSRVVALAPSSRWVSKQWPIDRWVDLLEPLYSRGFERCVILAAPGEEPQLEPLLDLAEQDDRLVDLAGQTSISQTMAAIAGCDLLIANDSAPLHMAVGLGTPSVGLFGPTDPAIVGPYEQPMHVVRAGTPDQPGPPVHFKDRSLGDSIMRQITIEQVLEAIDQRLD